MSCNVHKKYRFRKFVHNVDIKYLQPVFCWKLNGTGFYFAMLPRRGRLKSISLTKFSNV